MSRTIAEIQFNGHSMVGPLRRVLVCSPRTARWNHPEQASRWRELGFRHALDFPAAQAQHDALCNELRDAGSEVVELSAGKGLSLDAVYTHDASLATDFGLIALRSSKANRLPESRQHTSLCESLGIPILGTIVAPGSAEGGDMIWLDRKTLLVGCGYRTNAAGIDQVRALLAPNGVEVLSAPLPYGSGPSACLHLMSLISLLDERTAVVDLPWLAVETVVLLKARDFNFVEVDYPERDTLACNVLALGEKRLLAIDKNRGTNDRLRQAGFDVRTFPGSELCINGNGGPTCLTRPLLRG